MKEKMRIILDNVDFIMVRGSIVCFYFQISLNVSFFLCIGRNLFSCQNKMQCIGILFYFFLLFSIVEMFQFVEI